MPTLDQSLIIRNILNSSDPSQLGSAADKWAGGRGVFYVTGAIAGVDARSNIVAAITKAVAAGGGTVFLPYIGGYTISDTITVSTSNIHIVLGDNIAISKTTKAAVFIFTGASRTSRISNVSIRTDGVVRTINGNAAAMTGYTYNTADSYYSCVLFRWCDNWLAQNIYAYNALVNGLRAFQCGKGRFDHNYASDILYDNGQTVDFDPVASNLWSDTDPSTWSNAEIISPVSWNCVSGFGVTSYAATGVRIVDPIVWNCGNDNLSLPVAGGGISIEGDTLGAGRENLNRRCSILRPRIYSCYNAGIFLTATGTVLRDGDINGVIAPVNRPNAATNAGSGINVLGAATLDERGTTIRNCGQHGVVLLAAVMNSTNFYPSASIAGTIENSATNGIYGRGIASLTVQPTTRIRNTTSGMGVRLDNSGGATYNQGSGEATIAPALIENSFDRAILADYVATVHAEPRIMRNCRSGQGSTGAQINVTNATRVTHGDINNEDANGKTGSIMQIASSVTIGGGTGMVTGDYATSNVPLNNLAVTRLNPYANGQRPYSLAYAATITPNAKTMGNISVGALTQAITIAAPGGGPVAGDRFTIDFVQDATGGRAITWNATYKAITLAASGTASQKARITFEYDGTNWVQVATSGWYS